MSGNGVVPTRYGQMLYHSADAVIGRSIAYYGEYFDSEVDVFRHFVRPGDVVVDGGANIGTHTLALAHLVGAAGRVIAFEPQRLIFQMLCANMALNDITWADCHWAALAADDGPVHIPELDLRRSSNHGSQAVSMNGAGRQVAGWALDSIFDGDRLALIKGDVEGMETALVLGAQDCLRRFQPVVYLENDRLERSVTLISLLQDRGYICYWHLPLFHNPDNFNREMVPLHPCGFTDQGERLGSIGFAVNMLCLPAGRSLPALPGLSPVGDVNEHPYLRQYLPRFAPLLNH